MKKLGERTLYAPYATSLRMSNVGYSNQAQAELFVCFNSLESYAKTLSDAIRQPYPGYEKIGIKEGDQYKQLSSSVLQIENEYYSDIRPKRVAYSGEKQIHALRTRGVEYIEVRCLDINPYLPLGVDKTQIDFIDLFLLWCMVQDHPVISPEECRQLQKNSELVAFRGRDPELEIVVNGAQRKPAELAEQLIDSICRFAKNIDQVKQCDDYLKACEAQRYKILKPGNLLSDRVINDVKKAGSFHQFSLNQSEKMVTDLQQPLSEQRLKFRIDESKQSVRRQHDIESSDQGPFEQFLADYLQQ